LGLGPLQVNKKIINVYKMHQSMYMPFGFLIQQFFVCFCFW
jgi:hypothetical protein